MGEGEFEEKALATAVRGAIVEQAEAAAELRVSTPEGWTICNGEEGTPDLRDRFLTGAGSVNQIGVRAGAAAHSHAATSGQADGAYDSHAGMFAGLNTTRKSHTHPITVDAATVEPPHVKLVYIMKR